MIIKGVIKDFAFFGGPTFFGALTLILLILQKYILAFKLIAGFLACLLVVIAIRSIKFRERPKRMNYTNIIQKLDASSFPSMHSMRAMFLALSIGFILQNTLIYFATIFIALLTGFSRYYIKKHYITDIIAGYVIGIGLFYLII